MVAAAIVAAATADDDPAPYADALADAEGSTPGAATQREDRGIGFAGVVAGFGLLSVWLIGLGVGIHRARRRQALRQATTIDEESAP
jgi:hypothetical protein